MSRPRQGTIHGSDNKVRLSVAHTSDTRGSQEEAAAARKSRKSGSRVDKRRLSELKDQQLRLARVSWSKIVDPQPEVFLETLFRELFLAYPEYEYFFMDRRASKHVEIMTYKYMKSSMQRRLLQKLKDMLETLDKPEQLKELITTLGVYHAKLKVSLITVLAVNISGKVSCKLCAAKERMK